MLGVIGKPISHSRSPVLHNAALEAAGEDVVYVPLLVDDLPDFLGSPLFSRTDFAGFSVTIPHKEVALRCCAEVRIARRRGVRGAALMHTNARAGRSRCHAHRRCQHAGASA